MLRMNGLLRATVNLIVVKPRENSDTLSIGTSVSGKTIPAIDKESICTL